MPHEILDQVLAAQEATSRRATHIVFMGMGEPLLNLPAVLKSIACLTGERKKVIVFAVTNTIGD
jgi:adenine C2-methylase RlmN of 23S rRNA A2503 and tRNA A37